MQAIVDRHPSIERAARSPISFVWKLFSQTKLVPQRVLDRYRQPAEDDISWFVTALHDERRWFVARMATLTGSVPEALLEAMVISATLAEDPILNSRLICPCVHSLGEQRVRDLLLTLGESADPRRVVGAIDAAYWTGQSPESQGLLERRKLFLLEACLSETSEYARYRILRYLTTDGVTVDPSLFPESHRELAVRAQALCDERARMANESRPGLND
jgi:hypothetical protein